MLKGLPASGKTCWAKEQVKNSNSQIKRVNKDDLREMIDAGKWSKENEKNVLEIRDNIIRHYLQRGYTVICDDTNLHPKHEKALEDIVEDLNHNKKFLRKQGHKTTPLIEFEVNDSFCDVDYKECIKRDLARGDKAVGEKIIIDMYRRYLHKELEPIPYDENLPDCILVDVDGTLAIHEYRNPFAYDKCLEDSLNEPIDNLLTYLQVTNMKARTIIVTGRENIQFDDGNTVLNLTALWLNKNSIIYDDIYIREEKDHRPDYIVKKEMFEKYIKNKYNILYVLDDRKQVIDMWRKEGLTVLDVAGHDF